MGGADSVYFMTIIEKQVMQQDVAMDAAAMAGSIASTGSVAIYGIHFDPAKSELKPDSAPAIAEIAKLLKGSPALKVYVVGHTDMAGDPNANQMLSQMRAQSVINELITLHGISGFERDHLPARRLTSCKAIIEAPPAGRARPGCWMPGILQFIMFWLMEKRTLITP